MTEYTLDELKSLSDIPDIPDSIPEVLAVYEPSEVSNRGIKKIEQGLKAFKPQREIVAGGDIRWKPIDRQAATMFMKGIQQEHVHMHPGSRGGYGTVDEKADNQLRVEIARKGIKVLNKTMSNIKEFAEEAAEAKQLLDEIADTWRADVIEFTSSLPDSIEKVRNFRMTIMREKQLTKESLEDLRKFFLDKDHDTEMMRLNDFVRTCERLKALSDDGTLERVSDIMLKLEGA